MLALCCQLVCRSYGGTGLRSSRDSESGAEDLILRNTLLRGTGPHLRMLATVLHHASIHLRTRVWYAEDMHDAKSLRVDSIIETAFKFYNSRPH